MSDQSGGKTSRDAQSQKAETSKDESSQDVKPSDSSAEQDSLPGKGVGFPNIHFISSEKKIPLL